MFTFCSFCVGCLQFSPEATNIKFPDFKQSGVSLRSQRVCILFYVVLTVDFRETSVVFRFVYLCIFLSLYELHALLDISVLLSKE